MRVISEDSIILNENDGENKKITEKSTHFQLNFIKQ